MNKSLISKLIVAMTDSQVPQPTAKIFSLVRLKPDCKVAPVRADFSTPIIPHGTTESIIPVFNADQNFFTPSFVLPIDKKYFSQNLPFQKYQFEEKVHRSIQEISLEFGEQSQSEIYEAKPHSDFCQICQEKFENYQGHIAQKLHRNRCSHNETNKLIDELCSSFRIKQTSETLLSKTKTKQIRKSFKKKQSDGTQTKKISKNSYNLCEKAECSTRPNNQSTCLLERASQNRVSG